MRLLVVLVALVLVTNVRCDDLHICNGKVSVPSAAQTYDAFTT